MKSNANAAPVPDYVDFLGKAAGHIAKLCETLPEWVPAEELPDACVEICEGLTRAIYGVSQSMEKFGDLLATHSEDGLHRFVSGRAMAAVIMCAAAGPRLSRAGDAVDRARPVPKAKKTKKK